MAAVAVPMAGAQENSTVFGAALPDNAAPYDQQVFTELCDSTRTETSLSSVVTVYQRICGDTNLFDQFSDPLVVLDENLNLIPAAADSWEASEDGLSWTFHLHPGLMWNDGHPCDRQRLCGLLPLHG
ncbi:MAG: ABC transporter substrate-binding protein [Anaerolineae bacterium]